MPTYRLPDVVPNHDAYSLYIALIAALAVALSDAPDDVKVAVMVFADDIATVQEVPLDVSHPLQPEKAEPEAAVAVSVTDWPAVYDAVPVLPLQLMAPLDGVTVPDPVPDFVTVRA